MRARSGVVCLALAAVVIGAGGCARQGAALSPAPASGTSSQSATPTAAPAANASEPSVDSIQSDLSAADSATSGAGTDVSAGESAAATNDGP